MYATPSATLPDETLRVSWCLSWLAAHSPPCVVPLLEITRRSRTTEPTYRIVTKTLSETKYRKPQA